MKKSIKIERAAACAFMVKTPVNKASGIYQLAVTRGGHISPARARAAFVKSMGRGWTWRKCYARGCRVVVVDIRER